MLIVASKIKTMVKAVKMRTSAEFLEALSEIVKELTIEAAKNCKENGVNTLKARHLEGISVTRTED